jgi:hypothetical protein
MAGEIGTAAAIVSSALTRGGATAPYRHRGNDCSPRRGMATNRRYALQSITAIMCTSGLCEVRVANNIVRWFSSFSAVHNHSVARKASTSCFDLKCGTSTPDGGFAAPLSARQEVIRAARFPVVSQQTRGDKLLLMKWARMEPCGEAHGIM